MSRWTLLLLAACTAGEPLETDTDVDTTTEVDTDTDTGSDTDADTGVSITCDPLPITLPYALVGNSWFADFANAGDFSSGEGCTEASGTEVAFEVELVQDTMLTVIEAGGADVVIHVKEACDTEASCIVSRDDNTDDRLDWLVESTGTYTLVIEGWSENANGDYDIRIASTGDEVCDDAVDNDLDGLVDCDDPVCVGTVECPFDCPSVPATLPVSVAGDDFTLDYPNDAAWGAGADCIAASGAEALFDIPLDAGQQIRIQELGSLDATLHVVEECVAGPACLASRGSFDELFFTAPDTGVYTVVVEGASSSPFSRAYDIAITEVLPEVCDDGVDNDGDDDVDCEDVSCFDTDACPFECPAVPLELVNDLYSALGQNFSADASLPEAYSRGEGCVSSAGSVLAWEVDLARGESLRMSEVGRMNATWHVLESCVPGDPCLYSTSTDSGVAFEAPGDGVYTVVLQAGSTTDVSDWEAYLRRVPAEDCDVNGDEDLDGLPDCEDADCQGTDACPFTCDATVVIGSATVSGGDLNGEHPNAWNYSAGSTCSVADGSEVLFQIDLLAGQSVRVSELGAVDVAIHVLDSCLPESPCLASQGAPEVLEYTAQSDGTYTVVVEGRSALTTVGDYDIRVEFLEPEICDDGMDNDLDGLADCDDADCFGAAGLCTEELTCFDGGDNDADTLVDCDDPDCTGALGCGGGTQVLAQSFDTVPPAGWRIQDGGTAGATWELCQAPGCTDILTQWTSFQGAVGGFAYVNSDDAGFGTLMDDSLESPVLDLSSYTGALLTFDHLFDSGGGDSASVEVSTDSTTWTAVSVWTSDTVNGEPAAVSLNAVAGHDTVQFRFRYQSQHDWFWAVDNVVLSAE